MAKPPSNIAASVRARLLNLARETQRPLDQLLTRYALERLLYRLSLSAYRDRYVLKGALLVPSLARRNVMSPSLPVVRAFGARRQC